MITKSYRLIRQLNRRHSWLFRQGLGGLGYAGTWAVTGRSQVAALVRKRFIEDDTKYAVRLAGWTLRRGWPGLETVQDDFFDFTTGTDVDELDALTAFVAARTPHLPETVWRRDDLFLRAGRIHVSLNDGKEDVGDEVDDFYDAAARLVRLVAVPSAEPIKARSRAKEPPADLSFKHATQALSDLVHLLPMDEWGWFIISGTFLGVVREHNFIAHDLDIDIGLHLGDFDLDRLLTTLQGAEAFATRKLDNAEVVEHVQEGRYRISHVPALVKLVHRSGITVDVFFHRRRGDQVWHGSSIHTWVNSPFVLVGYELAGHAVRGPDDADRYLTENYGDWRTPVSDFDSTNGTPNLVITHSFRSVALFLNRLARFHSSDTAAYTKLRDTLVREGVLGEGGTGLAVERYI